ncbi:MAG TPA: FAD-dependent oxidoreductase [Candidatus Thermoplasmatota archaeon]|nr:FAD-dependent oxidoreductase [Candidatus Thermoplasmatota archaeon]
MEVPVAIVGGGVVGLGAAWALGRRGVRTAVLDPLPRRTDHNASNDESKIFRLAYADQAHYSRLALRSLGLWRQLERDARRPVMEPTGLLLLGRGPGTYARRTAPTLAAIGRQPGVLDAADLARAHPAFAAGGFDHAVLDRDAAAMEPAAVLESLEAEATAHRAKIFRGARVLAIEDQTGAVDVRIDAGVIRAERVIVAAGYRAPWLLPELAPLLRVTRQPEFAFAADGPSWQPPAFPIFAALEDGMYGFPSRRGAVKVADHRSGRAEPWEPARDPPALEEEQGVRRWLASHVPALGDAPLARSRLCHYDRTPDEDFLLGAHPQRGRVLLAGGFSGHGFKFAPAVGEALADWVEGRAPDKDWACCDPARLLR